MPHIEEVLSDEDEKQPNVADEKQPNVVAKKKKKKKKKKKGKSGPAKTQVNPGVFERLSNGRMLPSKLVQRVRQLTAEDDPRVVYVINNPNCTLDIGFDAAITDLETLWRDIFKHMGTDVAKHLSTDGREKVIEASGGTYNKSSLVYGEVDFRSLSQVILRHLDLTDKKVFYDIGSGSGRGVMAAALLHKFTKCCGVEIVPDLNEAANEVLERYQTTFLPALQEQARQIGQEMKKQDISFLEADFRELDWSDADVVWANSTCFDPDLMRDLARHSERMKIGSYFCTLTKEIPSDHWMLATERKLYKMSWGEATMCCHIKVREAISEEEMKVAIAEDAARRAAQQLDDPDDVPLDDLLSNLSVGDEDEDEDADSDAGGAAASHADVGGGTGGSTLEELD